MKKVEIMLDKKRHLAYPVYALIKLKKEYGIELKDLQDKDKAEDLETILAVVWAGLIHEDKSLTMEELGFMLDITQLPEISQKIAEVFEAMNQKNLQK